MRERVREWYGVGVLAGRSYQEDVMLARASFESVLVDGAPVIETNFAR